MAPKKANQRYPDLDTREPDDLDAYLETFDEAEMQELAAAEVALDLSIFLYRAREKKSLSQSAAAKLAGLQQQAVNRLEHPDGSPRLETVQRYLKALGYSLELRAIDIETGESVAAFPSSPVSGSLGRKRMSKINSGRQSVPA
jgi:transcriptional regulator with XRE-family HTH domain